jgi:Fur family iron response transcriptional regulator
MSVTPMNIEPSPDAATPRRSLAGCPVHSLREKLRDVGLRPTRQRTSLGWLLFAKGDRHISAEMLYEEAMRARVPVSLATVYNALNQFTQSGLLREVVIAPGISYFDTNIGPHHHFYFEEERRLQDIPVDAVSVSDLPPAPMGTKVARVEVVIRLESERK